MRGSALSQADRDRKVAARRAPSRRAIPRAFARKDSEHLVDLLRSGMPGRASMPEGFGQVVDREQAGCHLPVGEFDGRELLASPHGVRRSGDAPTGFRSRVASAAVLGRVWRRVPGPPWPDSMSARRFEKALQDGLGYVRSSLSRCVGPPRPGQGAPARPAEPTGRGSRGLLPRVEWRPSGADHRPSARYQVGDDDVGVELRVAGRLVRWRKAAPMKPLASMSWPRRPSTGEAGLGRQAINDRDDRPVMGGRDRITDGQGRTPRGAKRPSGPRR